MNNIKSLRNFGTIYLWIFVFKVLEVCGDVEYRPDTDTDTDRAAVIPAFLLKPYAYEKSDDDYTDDLLNERNAIATPIWQTLNKQQQQQLYHNKHLWPLITTETKAKNENSMTSKEITLENLNNFDSFKTKTTIWPKINKLLQQQYHRKANGNGDNDIKQQRHNLQHYFLATSSLGGEKDIVERGGGEGGAEGDKQRTSLINIHYRQNGLLPIPIIMEKHLKTQATRATKKSKTPFADANTTIIIKGVNEGDDIKENLFPLKDDNTSNVNDVDDGVWYENESALADEENGIANSNGNGNESFNYADNNGANSNYMMTHVNDNDQNKDSHMNVNHQTRRIIAKPLDKRAKPAIGHTPFLPAVSGGAMTNLGKFFRDLSKNVHVSEQYQWNADEQKLLEGDPNFGNIHHHLTKPNAATDEQTAEWIKAIRFYRPSQKIRSLVAMNPHGQWAHSSQFIDPNYMWVGLGK